MSDKEEEGGTYRAKERKQSQRSTVVDDQFFKLSEMSKFLDLEDQRENKRRQKEDEQNREGMMTFSKDNFFAVLRIRSVCRIRHCTDPHQSVIFEI
jgi:hypothetical protein